MARNIITETLVINMLCTLKFYLLGEIKKVEFNSTFLIRKFIKGKNKNINNKIQIQIKLNCKILISFSLNF